MCRLPALIFMAAMNNSVSIAVSCVDETQQVAAQQLAQQLVIPYSLDPQTHYDYVLMLEQRGLALHSLLDPKLKPLRVDFLSGKTRHRYQYGGGKGQLIAKACGIKGQVKPAIVDLTAGLGQDAFVLASLGCHVEMVERNPIIAALLADGLQRLTSARDINVNLQLHQMEAGAFLATLVNPSETVIYIDPMHPARSKSALVKKEMRMIRDIVGDDQDSAELLQRALYCHAKRVVVKLPRLAKPLGDQDPSLQFTGRSTRFDVYL